MLFHDVCRFRVDLLRLGLHSYSLGLGVGTFGAIRRASTDAVKFAVQFRNVGDSSGIRMPKLCVYVLVQLGLVPLPWQIGSQTFAKSTFCNSTEACEFD